MCNQQNRSRFIEEGIGAYFNALFWNTKCYHMFYEAIFIHVKLRW